MKITYNFRRNNMVDDKKVNIILIVLLSCIAALFIYTISQCLWMISPSRIYQSISLKIGSSESELYLSLLPGFYSIVCDSKPRYDVSLSDTGQNSDVVTRIYDDEKLLLETSKQTASFQVNKEMSHIKIIFIPQKTMPGHDVFVTIRPTF